MIVGIKHCPFRVVKVKMGIRQKIILTLSIVLLLTLSLNVWLNFRDNEAARLAELKNRGHDISRFIAKSLSFSVIGYDYHTIQLLLEELITTKDINYALVTNRNGKTMGESGSLSHRTHLTQSEVLVFEQAIHFDGRVIGHLKLGLNANVFHTQLNKQHTIQLLRQFFIIMFILIGEFIVLSILIVQPISRITSAMKKSTENTNGFIEAIETNSRDEFGSMTEEFNRMSQRVNEMNQELQSDVASADKQLIVSNNQLKEQSHELKRINDELRILSITDPLTGIYNRRHFDEQITTEVNIVKRYNQQCSLLLLDLDHFKSINDIHGHYAGDIVLKSVATTLLNSLRKTDRLFRVGGEEFAVLCKHTDEDHASIIAEKLRKSINDLDIDVEHKKIQVTTSIGVSTIPNSIIKGDFTRDDFYLCSDRALYYSKDNGRNRTTLSRDIPDDYEHFTGGDIT